MDARTIVVAALDPVSFAKPRPPRRNPGRLRARRRERRLPFTLRNREAGAYWRDRVAPARAAGASSFLPRPSAAIRWDRATRSRPDAEQAPSRRGLQGSGRPAISPDGGRPGADGGDRTAGAAAGRWLLTLDTAGTPPRRSTARSVTPSPASLPRPRHFRGPLRRHPAHVQRPAARLALVGLRRPVGRLVGAERIGR